MAQKTNEHGFDYMCEASPSSPIPTLNDSSSQLAAELYHEAGHGNLEEVKRLCTVHKLHADNTNWFFQRHSSRDYLQHAFKSAAWFSQPAVLEYLYGLGARPTRDVIQRVCQQQKVDILKLFLEHGVDLNQGVDEGHAPIIYAAANEEMLNIFLERGVDPNGGAQIAKRDFSTPIDTAMSGGRLDLAMRLVDHGADPKLSHALTRLADMCDSRSIDKVCEMTKYFIERGCNVNKMRGGNLRYGPGRPLHYAAQYKDSEPLIELLIQSGAEPRARSALNDTPLDWAIKADTNSPRKEELLMGAMGGPQRTEQAGFIYQHLGYLPLLGIWDEKGELTPEISQQVKMIPVRSERGMLSRLTSIFSKE